MSHVEYPLPMRIRQTNFLGSVCQQAEPFLAQAIENGGEGIIVVNNALTVKFAGRLLGYALETGECESGRMQRGRWYYPAEKSTRDALRSAYIEGAAGITLADPSDWVQYRFAYPYFRRQDGSHATREDLSHDVSTAVSHLNNQGRSNSAKERSLYIAKYRDRLERE